MTGQHALGVDVGGTKILAGVVDRHGEVVSSKERPTPVSSQEELLAGLDEAVEELLDGNVEAIGFGICSTIDQRAGRAISSVHIPLHDIDFRDRMKDRFGLPVGIDNDGNAAAIAEWKLGAGQAASHIVALTLGTGIGGGLILDDRPYRGSIGAGAELGHIVLDYGGAPCGGHCSGHGHFEAFAAGSAADEAAEARFGAGSNGKTLVDAALEGDQGAKEDLAELGRHLGAGIASLVNIFNPELVILGGGFSRAGDLILSSARETLAVEALRPGRDLVRLVPAHFGPEAGMIGAALVGFEALDTRG
ncbi:MAG TPA: ROK family protein [Gaiellaceae bacterium]|nr:ROK family protein [Gaiellaceae bacterium]